jgi:hypothetical protein
MRIYGDGAAFESILQGGRANVVDKQKAGTRPMFHRRPPRAKAVNLPVS